MNVETLIKEVEKMRDGAEREQLCTYVRNVSGECLTDAEREELGVDANQLIGYEQAWKSVV